MMIFNDSGNFFLVSSTTIFKDMTDLDIRQQMYKDQMEALEQDMLPFGIIDRWSRRRNDFTDNEGTRWQVVEDHQRSYF